MYFYRKAQIYNFIYILLFRFYGKSVLPAFLVSTQLLKVQLHAIIPNETRYAINLRLVQPAMMNLSHNHTMCNPSDSAMVTSTIYFVLVISFGVVGNGLLLAVFATTRSLFTKSINILIFFNTVINFMTSILFQPIILSMNFIFFNGEVYEYLRWTAQYIVEICVVTTLFTTTAIAAGTYLLIARPRTTYRKCFVGGKAICRLLAGMLCLAIVDVTIPWAQYWFSVLEDNDKRKNRDTEICLHVLIAISCLLNFCPLFAIPGFQFATIRTIQRSRNRVEAAKIPTDQSIRSADATQLAKSTELTTATQLDRSVVTGAKLQITDENATLPARCPTHEGTMQDALEATLGVNAQRRQEQMLERVKAPRVNPTEIRLIKGMLFMYLIIAITWAPFSLLLLKPLDDSIWCTLDLFGYFHSLPPAFIPFAFILTNKHYMNALRKMGFGIRKTWNGCREAFWVPQLRIDLHIIMLETGTHAIWETV